MRSAWWRRNLPWLLLLIPLTALALAVSSQRLVNYYLPWQLSAPQRADADGVVDFHQTFMGAEIEHERDVRMQLLSVKPVDLVGEEKAVDGARLWQIRIRMEAEPNVVLAPCEVELVADGEQYGFRSAKTAADENSWSTSSLFAQCEPFDTPGPTFQIFSDELEMPESPRPKDWIAEFAIAMPEGVQPEEFRLWWSEPEYASFPIPEEN